MNELILRPGRPSDLGALTRIYNHFVTHTHVTFDIDPVPLERRREWFAQFSEGGPLQLFVAEAAGEPRGYACSTPFKPKAAYRVSVETTVYLDPGCVGRGGGRSLMETLLAALTEAGVHGAYAGVALPNDASEALHRKLGYRRVGVLHEVGRKFDRYWDVAWYEKRLGES